MVINYLCTMPEKKIKVKHRKLGREQCIGIAYDSHRLIEIDERLKGKKHLWTLIHEILHILEPDWSETKVDEKSKEIAEVLWHQKYRRIDDGKK